MRNICKNTIHLEKYIFQMLSAAQHTNAILYWLVEIHRNGSLHKFSTFTDSCDFDRALMAIVRAFGNKV